jgi:hypothetical protein
VKKYPAPLVCGFGAGVLNVVPFMKNFSCCLLVPGAAILAIILDRKAKNTPPTKKIEMQTGLILGLLTGIFAAMFGSIFDLIITFITKNNELISDIGALHQFVTSLPISEALKKEVLDIFNMMADEIKNYGFSLFYTLSVLANGFIINTIFGMIGGLIGAQIINKQVANYSGKE